MLHKVSSGCMPCMLRQRPPMYLGKNRPRFQHYRSLSSPTTAGCKAMCAITIGAPRAETDVNLTPDKRTVLLQREADFLAALRAALEAVWDPARWQYAQSLAAEGSGHRSSSERPERCGVPANALCCIVLICWIIKASAREMCGAHARYVSSQQIKRCMAGGIALRQNTGVWRQQGADLPEHRGLRCSSWNARRTSSAQHK